MLPICNFVFAARCSVIYSDYLMRVLFSARTGFPVALPRQAVPGDARTAPLDPLPSPRAVKDAMSGRPRQPASPAVMHYMSVSSSLITRRITCSNSSAVGDILSSVRRSGTQREAIYRAFFCAFLREKLRRFLPGTAISNARINRRLFLRRPEKVIAVQSGVRSNNGPFLGSPLLWRELHSCPYARKCRLTG